MKKIGLLALLLLSSQSFAAEYLVKYNSNKAFNLLNSSARNSVQAFKATDHNSTARLVKVDIAESGLPYTLAYLLKQEGVQYVVPNFKLKAFGAPVDVAALREQWAIGKVQAEQAWAKAGNRGTKNVIVAVIDTGVDYRHPSLAPNMVPGYDFKENDNDPMDKTSAQNPGHGTHCAGAVGATGLVDGGIVGLAPNISIMPLRFLGEDGSGDLNAAIKAIDFAVEKGAQIISASWGATVPRKTAEPLLEAIKRADDKGVIFIAAAANDGKNNDVTEVYPANNGFPNSITVAASTINDSKPSWSNYGKATVHVASPGENIMSTLPNNKYGNLSGTSMATPLVSGLAALLKSQDMSLSGAQIRAILQQTGAKVSIATACDCRVDALEAVNTVLEKKMVIVPTAATLAVGASTKLSVMNAQGAVKFTSSNPSALTVDDSGAVAAVAAGVATITATDASGKSVSSLNFAVGAQQSPPDDGGGGGGGDGTCPIGDQALCDIICQIAPDLPFCQ